MPNLDDVARELGDVIDKTKALEKRKKELRPLFFDLIVDSDDDSVVPTRSIAVPIDFFSVTEISEEEFISSRFPAWNLTHREERDSEIIFVLARDKRYNSSTYRVDDIEVTKSVSENTPEIDFDTLAKEAPELFSAIAKREVVYSIDEAALEKVLDEKPELQALLIRHLKVKEPVLKVLSKRIKP